MLGIISALFVTIHTLFWCTWLFAAAVAKLLVPARSWRSFWSSVVTSIAKSWVWGNGTFMRLTRRLDYDVRGADQLDQQGWFLIACNHQAWADIPILQEVFLRRIPFIKFFLKQELIWVPVLGLAWWALDFPFMKRYSRKFLEAHPELRGKDLETTRKACERFRYNPVTVLNFLEGTRFTPHKHSRQNSPYQHLLKPKAGGIAFTIGAMGEKFTSMLDVTIFYPGGAPNFWRYMCGDLDRVVVVVREKPIPERFLKGDYMGDDAFRREFQQWIDSLWREKDLLLAELASESQIQTGP